MNDQEAGQRMLLEKGAKVKGWRKSEQDNGEYAK